MIAKIQNASTINDIAPSPMKEDEHLTEEEVLWQILVSIKKQHSLLRQPIEKLYLNYNKQQRALSVLSNLQRRGLIGVNPVKDEQFIRSLNLDRMSFTE